MLRLIHGGNDQAPYGRRHHDTGGKAGQAPLKPVIHGALHKKYAATAHHCPNERQYNRYNRF
jgi:hypothetical protein